MLKLDNLYSLDRERNRSCRVIPKDLKIGTKVRLHALQSKEEWNGKEAKITGKERKRNGVSRWPIQLVDSPNETAFVKRINMNGIGQERGSCCIIPLNGPFIIKE